LSVLIVAKFTDAITKSTAVEVTTVIVFLLIGIHYFDMVGVIAAVVALLLGRFCSNAYLHIPLVKALKTKSNRS